MDAQCSHVNGTLNCELVLHAVCGHMAPLIVPAKGMPLPQVGGHVPCSLLQDGPLMLPQRFQIGGGVKPEKSDTQQ